MFEPEELEKQFVLQDLFNVLNKAAAGTDDEDRRRDLYTAASMVRFIALAYNMQYKGSTNDDVNLEDAEEVLKDFYNSAKDSIEDCDDPTDCGIDHQIIAYTRFIGAVLGFNTDNW